MKPCRTLLRGAGALLGDDHTFRDQPLDVLVEGERIVAIEPAGTVGCADALHGLHGRLLVPGLVNGHQHSHEHCYRLDTVTFAPLNDPVRQPVYAVRGAGLDFAMVAGEVAILRRGLATAIPADTFPARLSDVGPATGPA